MLRNAGNIKKREESIFLKVETIKKDKVMSCLKSMKLASPLVLDVLEKEWEAMITTCHNKLNPSLIARLQVTPLFIYHQTLLSLQQADSLVSMNHEDLSAENPSIENIMKAINAEATELINRYSMSSKMKKWLPFGFNSSELEEHSRVYGPIIEEVQQLPLKDLSFKSYYSIKGIR